MFLDCQKYQRQGAKNLILSQTDGKDQIRYLRCTECQPQFSARKGSALFNSQIRASKAASIIDLVNCGHGVVDCSLPVIFTDGEATDKKAIRPAFGQPTSGCANEFPLLGCSPEPIMRIPHQLVSAKGIKHRRGGQRAEVEIGPILGTGKRNDVVPKLGWKQPQASAVEWFNLTDGQRNRRQPGRILGVSKQSRYDNWRSWILVWWYNFHLKNRSHNDENKERGLVQRTPVMATEIAH